MKKILKTIVYVIPILCFAKILFSADSHAYFPLIQDSTWEYQTYSNDRKESFVMQVCIDKPDTYKGTQYTILTQKDKRGTMRSFLEVTDAGILVKKTALRKSFIPEVNAIHEPAIPLFMFAIVSGYSFHWEGILKVAWVNKKIILDGNVIGKETITVPAGTFECIKLHFHQKRGDEITDEYAWYAPNVGQVKYIGGNYTKELTSYKIPAKP